MNTRRAELHRVNGETEVAATFTFDGAGAAEMSTGRAGMARVLPARSPSISCTCTLRCPPTRPSSLPAQTTARRWSRPLLAIVYGRCDSTSRRAPSWA